MPLDPFLYLFKAKVEYTMYQPWSKPPPFPLLRGTYLASAKHFLKQTYSQRVKAAIAPRPPPSPRICLFRYSREDFT